MSNSNPAGDSSIRLVLSDVDGTLVTHEKILTPRALKAVAGLRQAKILFAITSGRPPRGVSMINEALHLTTPISGFNGGLVVTPDYRRLSGHPLAADDARAVLEKVLEHGLDAWLYTDADWFVRDPTAPHVTREQSTIGFGPTVSADFGPHLAQAVKIVGVSDDPDRLAGCEREFHAWSDRRVSAKRSQPYYLDVTHPEATKGYVVRMLASRYGIAAAQIAVIGDGPNDILMFRASGFSIAMGNAGAEVQQAAMRVTASCEDEGFAKAMEQFVLPRVQGDHAWDERFPI